MGSNGAEGSTQGLLEIAQLFFGFADSMAIICAVELRIADIIHSQSGLVTLSQIASHVDDSSSLDISFLERIMALLVRKRVFAVHHQSDTGETRYGLTLLSRWLLHDSELSFAPMILLQKNFISFWHYLSQCVKEGGNSTGFKKAYDFELWEYASQDVEFSKLFNKAMENDSRMISKAVISGYKDGFNNIGSLVDVGGGIGGLAAEIVKFYPHIKAINYDLPHVITTAPPRDGVIHLGGDMFESVPNADAVLLKWVLHDWSDKDCIKILQSCRNAIPEKTGKVIIVEVVVKPDGNDPSDGIGLVSDLTMRLSFPGGKERTELEWKKLLEEGGFPTCKIIQIPSVLSIIEAYPY